MSRSLHVIKVSAIKLWSAMSPEQENLVKDVHIIRVGPVNEVVVVVVQSSLPATVEGLGQDHGEEVSLLSEDPRDYLQREKHMLQHLYCSSSSYITSRSRFISSMSKVAMAQYH